MTDNFAMARILAVANQKGGVAKTTTVASLGVALSELGRRVLLVDLDPQACLTFSLGHDPDTLDLSIHDVLLGRVSPGMAILSTAEGPDLLPSTIDLAGCEAALLTRTGREYALKLALEEVAGGYDDIVFDCAPLARGPHDQCPDSSRRGAGAAAVRDALPPRRRPAARHRGRSPAADQP